MSVYEFVCRDCKKKFQETMPIGEFGSRVIRCPRCKSRKLDRIWSSVNVHTARKS